MSSRIEILLGNALCCSAKQAVKVSKLLSINDNCANEQVKKLKLLNDSINTLLCYGYSSNSKFKYVITCAQIKYYDSTIPPSGYIFEVVLYDGIKYTNYTSIADGIKSYNDLYVELLNSIPDIISYTISDCAADETVMYTLNTICSVSNVVVNVYNNSKGVINTYSYTRTKIGDCINCLDDTQIANLENIIKETCDICECQLPQE